MRRPRCNRAARSFTLFELIEVMGLLAAVMGVTAPSLARFFHGRSLREEARRILALTRYARDRAVFSARPKVFWIDLDEACYGVETLPSYAAATEKPVTFHLLADVEFAAVTGGEDGDESVRREVVFQPDGTVASSTADSVTLCRRGEPEDSLRIVREEQSARYTVEK